AILDLASRSFLDRSPMPLAVHKLGRTRYRWQQKISCRRRHKCEIRVDLCPHQVRPEDPRIPLSWHYPSFGSDESFTKLVDLCIDIRVIRNRPTDLLTNESGILFSEPMD